MFCLLLALDRPPSPPTGGPEGGERRERDGRVAVEHDRANRVVERGRRGWCPHHPGHLALPLRTPLVRTNYHVVVQVRIEEFSCASSPPHDNNMVGGARMMHTYAQLCCTSRAFSVVGGRVN